MPTNKSDDFDLDQQIEADKSGENDTPVAGVDGVQTDAAEKELSEKLDKMLAGEDDQTGAEEHPHPDAKKTPAAKEKTPAATPATNQRTGQHSYGADGSVIGPDGKVIAKQGAERRHWERSRQQEQRAIAAERSVSELNQRVAQAEAVLHAGKELALSADEQLSSLKLFGWFKREPEAMLKWLLTEAQSRGYNMNTILGQESQGVNIEAVTRAVQQQLKPLVDRHQEQARWDKASNDASKELNDFYSEFPNAPVHEQQLANLMSGFEQKYGRTLSLREAYLYLENWAVREGLDVSRPLEPQVEARQAGKTLAAARRPANNFPRGRGGPVETVKEAPGSFNEFSYDSIVSSAMKESGLDPKRF
jgi:hypothetical protein